MAKTVAATKSPEPAVLHARPVPGRIAQAGPAADLLHLHRVYGNGYVQRLLKGAVNATAAGHLFLQRKCACGAGASGLAGECTECSKKNVAGLQTKLRVNEPGDAYEQEADRVAEQVLAKPAHPDVNRVPPRIQRFTGQSGRQMGAAPASVDRVLASPGKPLDPVLRQDMERRFGYDFANVRVHSGGAAEHSARELNAHAYTVGHNMVFGEGQFAPRTREGRRLLAHELTHIVQQQASHAATHVVQRDSTGHHDEKVAVVALKWVRDMDKADFVDRLVGLLSRTPAFRSIPRNDLRSSLRKAGENFFQQYQLVFQAGQRVRLRVTAWYGGDFPQAQLEVIEQLQAEALKAADARALLKASLPFVLERMTDEQVRQMQTVLDAAVVNPEVLNREADKRIRLDFKTLLTPEALRTTTDNPDEAAYLETIKQTLETRGVWLRFAPRLVLDPEDPSRRVFDERAFEVWLSLGPNGDTIPTKSGRLTRDAFLGTTVLGAGYYRNVREGGWERVARESRVRAAELHEMMDVVAELSRSGKDAEKYVPNWRVIVGKAAADLDSMAKRASEVSSRSFAAEFSRLRDDLLETRERTLRIHWSMLQHESMLRHDPYVSAAKSVAGGIWDLQAGSGEAVTEPFLEAVAEAYDLVQIDLYYKSGGAYHPKLRSDMAKAAEQGQGTADFLAGMVTSAIETPSRFIKAVEDGDLKAIGKEMANLYFLAKTLKEMPGLIKKLPGAAVSMTNRALRILLARAAALRLSKARLTLPRGTPTPTVAATPPPKPRVTPSPEPTISKTKPPANENAAVLSDIERARQKRAAPPPRQTQPQQQVAEKPLAATGTGDVAPARVVESSGTQQRPSSDPVAMAGGKPPKTKPVSGSVAVGDKGRQPPAGNPPAATMPPKPAPPKSQVTVAKPRITPPKAGGVTLANLDKVVGMKQLLSKLNKLNETFNSLGFETPEQLVDFLDKNPEAAIKELNQRLDWKLEQLKRQQAGKQKPDVPHSTGGPEKKWSRKEVIGGTPGVDSRVGRQVQARMRSEGNLKGQGEETQFFDRRTQKWHPIRDAQMGHTHDAVKWWNEKGFFYGKKSQLVIDWQNDYRNYELEYGPENMREGAGLRDRYVAPHPDPITPDELAGKVKPRRQ